MFPEEVIEEVRAANGVYEVISEYVSLKKTGVNYRGLCPFHGEKTPSFFVNPDKQIFHCFGCGTGGNVFTFLMRYEGITFPEAVRRLAERGGVALPALERKDDREESLRKRIMEANAAAQAFFSQQLASDAGKAAMSYLSQRGIGPEGIKRFGLGWSLPEWEALRINLGKKGFADEVLVKAGLIVPRQSGSGYYDRFRSRIIFPIANAQSEVVAFGGRVPGKDGEPKYLNSPETPVYHKGRVLYGLDLAKGSIRETGFAVLVEGNLDLVTAHLAGFGNAVATMGTALTRDHLRLLKRYTPKVVLVYDGDAAGIDAARRSLDLFLEEDLTVNSVTLPSGHDPDSLIRGQGAGAFSDLLKASVPLVDFFLEKTWAKWRAEGIDGKARAAAEILPVLARISNHIKRSEYLRKAALLLDVREEALMAQLKAQTGGGRPPTETPAVRGDRPRRPVEEEELLRAMLVSPELAHRIREAVPLGQYQDETCRAVAAAVYAAREGAEHAAAVSRMEDATAVALASRLLAEEEELVRMLADLDKARDRETATAEAAVAVARQRRSAELGKVVDDCLTRQRRVRLARELQEVQDKIKQAETTGEPAVLNELLRIKQSIARA